MKPKPRPVTMFLLTLVGIGFVWELMLGVPIANVQNEDLPALVRAGALFPAYVEAGQYWRLVSAMFIHIGLLHLAFNSWALYQLGSLFEWLFGSWRLLATWFVTGIVASIASIVFTRSVAAGASGAIFGILGALIVMIRRSPHWRSPRRAGGILEMLVVWAGINILIGFSWEGIDNAAHLGGLISGALMGLLPHPEPPPRPADTVIEIRPEDPPGS